MPRGKYVNHKGRSRHFTSPEELEQELEDSKKKKNRPKKADDESGSESESEEAASQEGEEGSEEEDSDEDDENAKAKGVSNLIEIENPNRAQKKAAQKVTKISTGEKAPKPELSRREREELEKQRAAAHYQKMHAEGKTEQARADLARLAIIKQHRAEAAARREAEKKEKEDKRKAGSAPAR